MFSTYVLNKTERASDRNLLLTVSSFLKKHIFREVMESLTPAQKELYDWLIEYIKNDPTCTVDSPDDEGDESAIACTRPRVD